MRKPALVPLLNSRPPTFLLGAIGASAILAMTNIHAQLLYDSGEGTTVYGVADYGGAPNNGAPTFIPNNLTGRNDILSSPAGGFLTADLGIPNNIAQTPVDVPLPLGSFLVGGGNGNGAFGASANLITGPTIGFNLQDFSLGGGSASYTLSSWTADFVAGANGYDGTLDAFLLVGGDLVGGSGGSADAVSLVASYSINGGAPIFFDDLVLAAAGNGNFNAVGDEFAAVAFAPGNEAFVGFALDSRDIELDADDTLRAVITLTAIADPAAINSVLFDDPLLGLFNPDAQSAISDLQRNLGNGSSFAVASTAQSAPSIPDSGSMATLLVSGWAVLAAGRKRSERTTLALG